MERNRFTAARRLAARLSITSSEIADVTGGRAPVRHLVNMPGIEPNVNGKVHAHGAPTECDCVAWRRPSRAARGPTLPSPTPPILRAGWRGNSNLGLCWNWNLAAAAQNEPPAVPVQFTARQQLQCPLHPPGSLGGLERVG